jgi:predicted HTH transcriptional regulator
MGRLRKALGMTAGVHATKTGFVLVVQGGADVAVLAPLSEEAHASVLALLSDGEAWSSSALALALGESQRTVQRALDDLAAAGKARAIGQARARRWTTPSVPGFPTALLLPVAPSGG